MDLLTLRLRFQEFIADKLGATILDTGAGFGGVDVGFRLDDETFDLSISPRLPLDDDEDEVG